MQRVPPTHKPLAGYAKGFGFHVEKTKTAVFFSLCGTFLFYMLVSAENLLFDFLGAAPVFQYTVYPWFSLLITVLKHVKQALPPPEIPSPTSLG